MQSNYVGGELLSGLLDGINTQFTTIYPIDRVDEVNVGGVGFDGYTYGGNIVNFDLAPTLEMGQPSISYFRADVIITPLNTGITFQELIDDVYMEIGQSQASRQYPLELVKGKINEGVRFINNMRTNAKYKISGYSFNKAGDMYIQGAYNPLEISVTPSPTSYVPNSGKVMFQHSEVVDYTAKTTTGFTGLSNYTAIPRNAEKLIVGYKIPDGVQKVSEVILDGRVLDLADRREFSIEIGNETVNQFTLIDGYIFLPFSTNNDAIVTVNYVKPVVPMSLTTDYMDFEVQYKQTIVYYALKQLFRAREEYDRMKAVSPEYVEHMKWYRGYLRQVDGINNIFPSSSFSGF